MPSILPDLSPSNVLAKVRGDSGPHVEGREGGDAGVSVGWLVGVLAGWLPRCLVTKSWLAGWLVGWLAVGSFP